MEIIHATTAEFDKLLSDHPLVLVDFWAGWCGPCRMVAPIVEELADKYDGKLTVAKVDVDEQQELARQYGIMNIPTVILFKDGKKEWMEVGVKSKSHYEGLIEPLV